MPQAGPAQQGPTGRRLRGRSGGRDVQDMHASQPPPLRVAAAQCLQGSDRTTSPQNGGQLPGVTPGWAWPGQRAQDGGRGHRAGAEAEAAASQAGGGLPRPQADYSPAGSQWEGGERSSWVPPCRSPRPQPLGPRRDAGRGLCARREAAATRPGSGPTPSTCRGSSCSGPGGLVPPSTPRGFAAPATTPEQIPARSLHLSVREKGWGVGPPPHHKETPEERKRQGDRAVDVGASDKDASYVVGEMQTKTATSHRRRPSGPWPESATPTSPAAGKDVGPREPPCTAGGVQAVPRSGRGLGALDPTHPRRRARRPCATTSVCPEAERGRAQTFAAAFLVTAKTWLQPLGGRTEKRAVAHPTTEGHPAMKANELSGRQRTRRNGKRMSPGEGSRGERAASRVAPTVRRWGRRRVDGQGRDAGEGWQSPRVSGACAALWHRDRGRVASALCPRRSSGTTPSEASRELRASG